jgi:ABC-2 type transport system ATP-binding protein
MIEVEHLTKDYGSVVAVDDVSFSVGEGEIVGFLGPNGAGKTTTLRVLSGFLGATRGTVRVAGFDVATESLAARSKLGYMPEAAPLHPELRVREYLAFRAEIKRVPRRERPAAIARSLEQAAVNDVAETPIGHLSKGYRQRVALADALVANPPLLILDEPTAGLDPNQIVEVRRLIRELGKERTILLSTHILPEVEAVCDRALVIARGKLVGQGTLAELKAHRRAGALEIVARGAEAELEKRLAGLEGVSAVSTAPVEGETETFRLTIELAETATPSDVAERSVAALVAQGAGVQRVVPAKASLEDVFRELTARDEEQPEKEAESAKPDGEGGT